MAYDNILVDPPWQFDVWSDKSQKGAHEHYPTLDMDTLGALPIGDILADDGAVLLWVCDSMLRQAWDTVDAWGLVFKTVAFTWAKTTKDGGWHIGLGYYTRGNPENCWLLTRPDEVPKRVSSSVRQLVTARAAKHSAKPPEVRDRIVRLFGDRPRIELFARNCAPGWHATGLDYDGLDVRDALQQIKDGTFTSLPPSEGGLVRVVDSQASLFQGVG